MLAFLLSVAEEEKHDIIKDLYEKYHSEMVIIAKSLLRTKRCADVEFFAADAVQNAFLKFITRMDKIDFNATERQLRGYLMATLENEVRALMKDRSITENIDDYINEIDDEGFFEKLRISDRYHEVSKALESLDEKYQTVMLYRYTYDMSVSEIAEHLGVPEKTVYTRLSRGKHILIAKLNKEVQSK